MMVGPPEYLPDREHVYVHVRGDLAAAILGLISRENAVISSLNPREAVYPGRVVHSIPEKILEVLERLRAMGSLYVADLFYTSGSRTELIATFIAVLELCRVGSALLTGDDDEITITYTGAGRDPTLLDFTEDNESFIN